MILNTNVLFVDDEANILNAAKRVFMGEDVSILTARSGEEGLDILKANPVAVIVSDNMMPHMKGIEFLSRSKQLVPDCIRILMTAHADLQIAINSINQAGVSHFITKPWDDTDFKKVITDALTRFNTASSMKAANEPTLLSLAQTIELKDPYTRGHCDRVARYALDIADKLDLSTQDKQHLKYGSWLHDCGKIGVPESILNYNGPLSPEQTEIVKKHTEWGAEVARLARLPEQIINIILYHHEKVNGSGYPHGLTDATIPFLAKIVSISDCYDALATDRPYRKALPHKRSIEILAEARGIAFNTAIFDVFLSCVAEHSYGNK